MSRRTELDRRSFVGAGLTALALGGGSARAQSKEILIGALYPFTGSSAQTGVDAKAAFETTADIINGAHDLDMMLGKGGGIASLGGAKIRMVYADHQGDPQKGRAEAERLITQEKVTAMVGAYFSSVTATASAACERYQIPFVAADASSPSLQRRGLKYFFRASAHDEFFSVAMFDFMDSLRKQGQKIESIGLFHEDTIFGTDSATAQLALAKERGYAVAVDIKYRANSPSLTSEVQQLSNAKPDVLMPSSYTTDGILLIKTMSELGYKPKAILAQAAGFSEKSLYDAVGDKLEGAITRGSFSLDLAMKRPVVGKVNDLYKARSGKDLNDNTSREVMALLVLADAINRAKSTEGPAIRDALSKTDIPGDQTIMPWRKVVFGEDGQNNFCDPVLLQYFGGNFVTIFPESAAVAKAKWPMN